MTITDEHKPTKMEQLLNELDVTAGSSGSLVAHCPAHNDSHPSLVIGVGTGGKLLLHCRAGCTHEEVRAAIGVNVSGTGWTLPEGYEPADSSHGGTVSEERYTALLQLISAGVRDMTDEARAHARERFGLT